MAAFVSTPVVAYSTTAAWITAPAIGAGSFAWLEVGRSDGDVRVVASFRGDRLLVRASGKNTPVVHEPCMMKPCNTVQGPMTESDGSFAYAVAFPGTGGYVANVTAAGVSNVVAEDQTDPREITTPHLIATVGTTVLWVDDNIIYSASSAGGATATLVTAEQAGGTITSIAASGAGVAWAVKPATGGTALGFRDAAGAISTRVVEANSAAATIYSVGLADDGTIVAIRRTLAKGRQQTALMAYGLDGVGRTLLKSATFGKGDPFELTRPAVTGTRVAVRMRGGNGGVNDELWMVDLATGKSGRITSVPRTEARLTDASFGGGRLVWAKDELTSRGRLLRARLYSAAVKF